MNIYSVKNEKLEFFNAPMFFETSNGAMSHMQKILMADADRALFGLKDDLALYFLGTVDFVSGKIDTPKKPIKIADLRDLFETIPQDRVPRTAEKLQAEIDSLNDKLANLNEDFSNMIESLQSGRFDGKESDYCVSECIGSEDRSETV